MKWWWWPRHGRRIYEQILFDGNLYCKMCLHSSERHIRLTAYKHGRPATKPFTPILTFCFNFFSLPVPTATPERTFSVMKILNSQCVLGWQRKHMTYISQTANFRAISAVGSIWQAELGESLVILIAPSLSPHFGHIRTHMHSLALTVTKFGTR